MTRTAPSAERTPATIEPDFGVAEVGWVEVADLLAARRRAIGRWMMTAAREMDARLSAAEAAGTPVAEFTAGHRITGIPVGPPRLGPARGRRRVAEATIADVLRAGWSAQTYGWLRHLAEALPAGTGMPVGWRRSEPVRLAWHLTGLAERATVLGARWADLRPWLVLLAHAEDDTVAEGWKEAIKAWDRPSGNLGWLGVGRDWRDHSLAALAEMFGPCAGWAVAAGVPLTEVRAGLGDGTLTAERLQVLAALRDYRVL